MSDITVRNQGNVSDEGKTNWRSGDSSITPGDQSIFDTSSVQLNELGNVKVVGDRVFRYAQANGTLTPGVALQTTLTSVSGTAGNTDPSGGKQITFFFSSAAASSTVAANYYAEGMVYFGASGTSTQMGMGYRVKSHPVVTTSGNIVLSLYEPIKYNVITTDTLVLIANPYSNVIANATGGLPCPGICVVNATTGDYMWIQSAGPCPVVCSNGGINAIMVLGNTGGLQTQIITTANATAAPLVQIIGWSMVTQTAGKPGAVWLTIEP